MLPVTNVKQMGYGITLFTSHLGQPFLPGVTSPQGFQIRPV